MTEDFELKKIPNVKYQKFFDRFKEIETLDVTQWKSVHLLAYFCSKYKVQYGVDYSWKFNHESPSKCFEVWQLNSLTSKLSTNPVIVKEYIDWSFENIVPKAKRRLTSISFLNKDEVLNPYKVNLMNGTNIDRNSKFPENYKNMFNELSSIKINTYGDLGFILLMQDLPSDVKVAIDKIKDNGFNIENMRKVK